MKENEMITPENLEAVDKYVDENYIYVSRLKHAKAMHAYRCFESIEGFTTRISLSIFYGERLRSVIAYLSIWRNEKRNFKNERICIERMIFSLDELKEIESKAEELNRFAEQLGLWKK